MSFYKEVPGRQTTLESTLKFDLAPTAGSTNPVTSDGVNNAVEASTSGIIAVIPAGTTTQNPLVNRSGAEQIAGRNKAVAIADAFVLRRGQVGQGWYKLAESTTPRANYNINSVFDVVASTSNCGELRGSFVMSVRYEGNGVVNVFTKSLFSDAWSSDYPIKIVTTKVSSTVLKVELFFGINPSNTTTAVYSGISLSERNSGNYGGTDVKNAWIYTNYEDVAGSEEPTSDAGAGRDVIDVGVYVRQHSISSPTDGNIVVMDENGNIKDSGVNISDIIS